MLIADVLKTKADLAPGDYVLSAQFYGYTTSYTAVTVQPRSVTSCWQSSRCRDTPSPAPNRSWCACTANA